MEQIIRQILAFQRPKQHLKLNMQESKTIELMDFRIQAIKELVDAFQSSTTSLGFEKLSMRIWRNKGSFS